MGVVVTLVRKHSWEGIELGRGWGAAWVLSGCSSVSLICVLGTELGLVGKPATLGACDVCSVFRVYSGGQKSFKLAAVATYKRVSKDTK